MRLNEIFNIAANLASVYFVASNTVRGGVTVLFCDNQFIVRPTPEPALKSVEQGYHFWAEAKTSKSKFVTVYDTDGYAEVFRYRIIFPNKKA
jgi:hypothetical protein